MKHYFSRFSEKFCYFEKLNIDILRLFYHQNTARTNPIIIQSVLFYDVLPNYLKYLQVPFTFKYHFCTDDLLLKIIVLKEAKINAVSYNPPKNNPLFV